MGFQGAGLSPRRPGMEAGGSWRSQPSSPPHPSQTGVNELGLSLECCIELCPTP
jgi:hypothetical protein